MRAEGPARITTTWVDGPAIGADLLETLRTFRMDMVRLRPDVLPDADRAKLADYFAPPGSRAAVFRDADGGLVGFGGFCDEAVELAGRNVCVMTPEYFFLGPQLRGTGLMARTALRWLAGVTRLDTIPPDVRPRSPAGQRALARYEASNPRWREGFAIPVLMPFGVWGGGALRSMTADAGRRTLKTVAARG